VGSYSYPNLPQYLPQRSIGLPCLGVDRVQIRQRSVGFGVAGVDVAAGGDVVVVLRKLGVIDDAAELFLFVPPDEGRGGSSKEES